MSERWFETNRRFRCFNNFEVVSAIAGLQQLFPMESPLVDPVPIKMGDQAMRHTSGLPVTWCVALFIAVNVAFCSDDSAKGSPDIRHGYVHCGSERNPPSVPVYEHPRNPKPIGALKCGDAIDVFSREGPWLKMPWLKIKNGDNTERYIDFYSVSYDKKDYLPIDLSVADGTYIPVCREFLAKLPTHSPIALYQTDPEYTEEGRSANVSGTVRLSLTVGTDGLAHDVTVTKSIGHGLDEKAVHSIQEWRFEPAAENGKPVPARITVEVTFTLYK
jgi:TonB family protein